jgi:hypothetical protein
LELAVGLGGRQHDLGLGKTSFEGGQDGSPQLAIDRAVNDDLFLERWNATGQEQRAGHGVLEEAPDGAVPSVSPSRAGDVG